MRQFAISLVVLQSHGLKQKQELYYPWDKYALCNEPIENAKKLCYKSQEAQVKTFVKSFIFAQLKINLN